jgi:hypothetical protein
VHAGAYAAEYPSHARPSGWFGCSAGVAEIAWWPVTSGLFRRAVWLDGGRRLPARMLPFRIYLDLMISIVRLRSGTGLRWPGYAAVVVISKPSKAARQQPRTLHRNRARRRQRKATRSFGPLTQIGFDAAHVGGLTGGVWSGRSLCRRDCEIARLSETLRNKYEI